MVPQDLGVNRLVALHVAFSHNIFMAAWYGIYVCVIKEVCVCVCMHVFNVPPLVFQIGFNSQNHGSGT